MAKKPQPVPPPKPDDNVITIPPAKSSRRDPIPNRKSGPMDSKKGKKGYRRHPKHKGGDSD